MTKQQESKILTRVGPGTPMGNVLRHYWFPALKSSELVPDGAPVRFLLLGEQLIAFRDTRGRIGIMDHRCPHRCTSLFFGRNEENGIRCVYHGWKYDYLGNCVDQPNLPPHRQFKSRCTPRPIARPNATASLMSIWETPRGYRRCPTSPHYIFLKARPISASFSGTATGSRVSKAISTPLT